MPPPIPFVRLSPKARIFASEFPSENSGCSVAQAPSVKLRAINKGRQSDCVLRARLVAFQLSFSLGIVDGFYYQSRLVD